ncbi:MAG: phospholipid carrier-dependent glycosyltransferase [Bacteroidales bacterium]|nr:phospholipid carrier-dependent glycosyltransferase [Bacteroidales bacterium]
MNQRKQKITKNKFKLSSKLFLVLYIPILLFSFFYNYNIAYDQKIDMGGDNAYYYILGNSVANGEGFTNIQTKEKIANTHFPPGYPLIIAIATKTFSNDIGFIKKLNGFFLLLSIGLIFLIISNLTGNYHIPFITSLFLLSNYFLLRYSTIMMSEIPFLFFSTLGLWVVMKTDFNKPLIKNWLFFLLIIIIAFTYQIRSFGLALFVGITLYLVFKKNWKYLTTLTVGFILLALPWHIRNSRIGGNSYVSQLMEKNPYRPELGDMRFTDWFHRVWVNLERYITREIPSGTIDLLHVTNYKQPITFSEWIIGIIILGIMIFGLIKLKKYFWLFFFYIVTSFGILLLWPDVWIGTRFMLPLIPLLTFFFINGIVEIITWLGIHILKIKNQTIIYIVLSVLSVISIKSYGNIALYNLKLQAKGRYTNNYQNYFKIAEWIKENAPENSVTSCRKGALFYLHSGKFVTGFDNTENKEDFIKFLEKQGTNYVVLDHLGYSSTARYLFPTIKRYPNKFKKILYLKDPDTYLFQFYPQLGYWGPWKNDKRNGYGSFVWANGMRFEGLWKDNVRSGKGVLINPSGERLEGVWANDKLNGMAVVKTKEGIIKEYVLYKENQPVKIYVKEKKENKKPAQEKSRPVFNYKNNVKI